eukprot:3375282-Amphidinium_carterae.2
MSGPNRFQHYKTHYSTGKLHLQKEDSLWSWCRYCPMLPLQNALYLSTQGGCGLSSTHFFSNNIGKPLRVEERFYDLFEAWVGTTHALFRCAADEAPESV